MFPYQQSTTSCQTLMERHGSRIIIAELGFAGKKLFGQDYVEILPFGRK